MTAREKAIKIVLNTPGVQKVYDVNAVLVVVKPGYLINPVIKAIRRALNPLGLNPRVERNDELNQVKFWL